MNKKKGYLVFTSHDGDEIDATFVPETETEIIAILTAHVSDDAVMEAWGNWFDAHRDALHWHTQTRCNFNWPFNDYTIIGTFYHSVY